jgi:hypothetical protein
MLLKLVFGAPSAQGDGSPITAAVLTTGYNDEDDRETACHAE